MWDRIKEMFYLLLGISYREKQSKEEWRRAREVEIKRKLAERDQPWDARARGGPPGDAKPRP